MADGKFEIEKQLQATAPGWEKVARFFIGTLSAIPVVGGAIGAGGSAWSEHGQEQSNKLFAAWLKLQEEEIKEISQTIVEVMSRLDSTDEKVRERIESKEYLSLFKKCFRDWAGAESELKRTMIRNLLINAAAPAQICLDDVIGLFIKWIEDYSEAHFKIVKAIYNSHGITRLGIWQKIDGKRVTEDSSDADLYKTLLHDLSVGHIIRQHREVDYHGNFVKKESRPSGTAGVKSAFDDKEQYELTKLGQKFVHYVLTESVVRIEAKTV